MKKAPNGYTEVLYVEVKRPGEKPTEEQLAMHELLRVKAGAKVIVATSLEDIERELAA